MAEQRRCIGSAKFGIAAHDAPTSDFPVQPSQRDGLGRMCKPHWNEYTNALRKAALARKANTAEEPIPEVAAAEPEASEVKAKPAARRRQRAAEVAQVGPEPPTD